MVTVPDGVGTHPVSHQVLVVLGDILMTSFSVSANRGTCRLLCIRQAMPFPGSRCKKCSRPPTSRPTASIRCHGFCIRVGHRCPFYMYLLCVAHSSNLRRISSGLVSVCIDLSFYIWNFGWEVLWPHEVHSADSRKGNRRNLKERERDRITTDVKFFCQKMSKVFVFF